MEPAVCTKRPFTVDSMSKVGFVDRQLRSWRAGGE
jgi:hypothetical protein